MLLKDYRSKKHLKKFARQLERASTMQTEYAESEVQELVLIMEEAYRKSDDHTLKNVLLVLSYCRLSKRIICPIFLSALLWRPNWGDYYDPKLWREDLTFALNTLLNSELLISTLSRLPGHESIINEFAMMMHTPLLFLQAIQNDDINEGRYFKAMSLLIIAVLDPIYVLREAPINIENLLAKIELLDHRLETLTNEFESFQHTELYSIIRSIRLFYNSID